MIIPVFHFFAFCCVATLTCWHSCWGENEVDESKIKEEIWSFDYIAHKSE